MLVISRALPLTDARQRLLQILGELRIYGAVVGFKAEGTLHRYPVQLGGQKKPHRVQVLAPDIAQGMNAIAATVTQLDGDGLLEIALLTGPYVSVAEHRERALQNS